MFINWEACTLRTLDYVCCFDWQVRDTAHREAREAEVVATDAEQLRTDAEDTQDMVQMAVDAAESK